MTMLVLNTKTLALSEYDLAWTGVAVVDNRLIGVQADGVYEQTGDDDAGAEIDAYIETGEIDFGDQSALKRVPEARLYGRWPAGAAVTARRLVKGLQTSVAYTVPALGGTKPGTRRVKLGKGPRSVAWRFRVANVDGGDLSVHALAVLVRGSMAAR